WGIYLQVLMRACCAPSYFKAATVRNSMARCPGLRQPAGVQMRTTSSRFVVKGLLVAQAFDGIEICCFSGWPDSKDQPDSRGNCQAADDSPCGDGRGKFRHE